MKKVLLSLCFLLMGGALFAQTYNYEILLEKRRGGADSLMFDIFFINRQAPLLYVGSGDVPVQFTVADWAAISNGTGAQLIDTTGAPLNGTAAYLSDPNMGYEPMVLSVSTISRRLIVRFVKNFNNINAAPPLASQFALDDTIKIGTILTRVAGAPYCDVPVAPIFANAGTIGSWQDNGAGEPDYLIHNTIVTPISVTVAKNTDAPLSTRLVRSAGGDSLIYVDTLILYADPLLTGETGFWTAHGASTAFFDSPTSPSSIVRDLGFNGLVDTLVWNYTVTANGCLYTDTIRVTAQLWAIDFPLVNDTLCNSAGPYTLLDASSSIPAGAGTWTSSPAGSLTFADPTSPTSSVSVATGFGAGTYRAYWTRSALPNLVDSVDITFITIDAGTSPVTVCDSIYTFAAPALVAPVSSATWSQASGPVGGTSVFTPATSPTGNVTVNLPGTYRFYWTGNTVGACTPRDSVDVTFNFITAGPDQVRCDLNTATMAGADPTAIGATGGVWAVTASPGGSGAPVFSPNNTTATATVTVDTPGLYTFTWTTTGTLPVGCATHPTDAVNITFNYVNAGPDSNICGVFMPAMVASDAFTQIGVNAAWSQISGPIGGTAIFGAGNSPASSVTVNIPGTYVLRWETVTPAAGCVANHFDEVSMTFVVAAAGPNQDICTNTTPLAATPATLPFVGTWVSINAGFTVADPANPTTTFTTTNPAGTSDSLVWEITDGFCSTRDTVVIRNNRVDVKTVQGDTTFCGAGTPVIRVLASDLGVTYTAYDGVTPLSGAIPGIGGLLNIPLTLFPASGAITVTVEGTRTLPFACAANMTNTVLVNRTAGLGIQISNLYLEGCIDTTGATPANFAVLNSAGYTLLDDIYSSGAGVGVPDPTGFVIPADSNTTLAALPANAVDVIKLEIRATPAGATLDSAFAWLMADGTIRDFATVSSPVVNFCDGNPDGNYYIVIRHKNHLPVMTSTDISLASAAPASVTLNTAADFYQDPGLTSGIATIVKSNAPAYTVFALLGGNVYDNRVFNDVGEVNAADFFRMRVTSASNPANVYGQTDASLNGDLNAFDVTVVRVNNNDLRITSVPNP